MQLEMFEGESQPSELDLTEEGIEVAGVEVEVVCP